MEPSHGAVPFIVWQRTTQAAQQVGEEVRREPGVAGVKPCVLRNDIIAGIGQVAACTVPLSFMKRIIPFHGFAPCYTRLVKHEPPFIKKQNKKLLHVIANYIKYCNWRKRAAHFHLACFWLACRDGAAAREVVNRAPDFQNKVTVCWKCDEVSCLEM